MTEPIEPDQALKQAAGWSRRRLLAGALLAFVGALVVAGGLAADVEAWRRLDAWGHQVGVEASRELGWLRAVARGTTFWGNTPVVVVVTALVVGWQLRRRRTVLAAWLVSTVVLGWAGNHALKRLVGRERPPTDGEFLDALSTSFPSGHAQVAGYGWVTLGLLALLVLPPPRRALVAGVCWGVGPLIAVSRVLLGVHWPTDVLAGYLIGLGWALVSASLLVTYARSVTGSAGPPES